jgi:membrane associated rhomboid family serine protease
MSYYRSQYRPEIGLGGHITPGIKALILVNVGVFILQVVARFTGEPGIELIFGLTPSSLFRHLWIWQVFTYMFLHSTNWLGHLLLNMLMLWMFGCEVERVWGTRTFVRYYLLCGTGAGVMTTFFNGFFFPNSTTIGASGAVFGVMLAYGMLYPNRQILFWFIFPMRAITFVLLCVGIEMFSLLSLQDGVAHFAHLGGMLFGYFYMKRAWRIREFVEEIRWKIRRRRFKILQRDDKNYPYH